MRISGYEGFALISVLLFLQIFSLLSLFSLNSAALSLKGARHAWQGDKMRLLSNQILDEIEVSVMQQLPACVTQRMPDTQLASQPRNWWLKHACHAEGEGMHYHYVIESLGQDPCAVLTNKKEIADYFRLTFVGYSSSFSGTKIILQSSIIRPKLSKVVCTDELHPVKIGEQMRRQLVS